MKLKILSGVLIIALSLGAWDKNGSPVCQAPGDQFNVLVGALSGKRIAIVWLDRRGGESTAELYLQVIDSLGNPLFTKDGIRVCDVNSNKRTPAMATDGDNIYLVWVDHRVSFDQFDIYMEKINGRTGEREFNSSGVPISIGPAIEKDPQLCLDGSGEGCYITWTDYRSGNSDVWAARVTADGQVVGEVGVCSLPGPRCGNPALVPSGSGALIFWGEKRSDTVGLYGNRILGDSLQWGRYGKLIIVSPYSYNLLSTFQEEYSPSYAHPDHNGGAFVFYYDRVQRVDSLGNLLFNPPPEVGSPYKSAPVEDYSVVGCYPLSAGSTVLYQHVKISKVDSSGIRPWGQSFRVWTSPIMDTTYYNEPYCSVVGDFQGGCVVAIGGWQTKEERDMIVVHVDSSGNIGEPEVICDALGEQQNLLILQNPFIKGYFVVWEDSRSGNLDIYGMALDSLLRPGIQEKMKHEQGLFCLGSTPNPFIELSTIGYQLPDRNLVKLNVFNASGQLVKTLVEEWEEPGYYKTIWNGTDDEGKILPSGIYFYELTIKSFSRIQKETKKAILLRR